MLNILNILKNQKTLNVLVIPEDSGFDGLSKIYGEYGGGGGGAYNPGQGGGTGGSGSGTTSGVLIPTLSVTPSTNQIVAIGSTICFTASGSISLPQQQEQFATLVPLNASSTYSNGTYIKVGGVNNNYDADAVDPSIIYQRQPFHIVGTNSSFTTPGTPDNNSSIKIGVKSTGGYEFYWEVSRYCNAVGGGCTARWYGFMKIKAPNGSITVIPAGPGYTEPSQQFKVRSDGIRIIWEFTTENNWVYNYKSSNIPDDCGDFQFFTSGLFTNNRFDNIRTYKGSYQGTVSQFEWNTSGSEVDITVTGNTACIIPLQQGSFQLCVATNNVEPICVGVQAVPLYLRPKNLECNSCS